MNKPLNQWRKCTVKLNDQTRPVNNTKAASHKAAEELYKSAAGDNKGPGPGAPGAGPEGGDAKPPKDDVIDAEIVD